MPQNLCFLSATLFLVFSIRHYSDTHINILWVFWGSTAIINSNTETCKEIKSRWTTNRNQKNDEHLNFFNTLTFNMISLLFPWLSYNFPLNFFSLSSSTRFFLACVCVCVRYTTVFRRLVHLQFENRKLCSKSKMNIKFERREANNDNNKWRRSRSGKQQEAGSARHYTHIPH